MSVKAADRALIKHLTYVPAAGGPAWERLISAWCEHAEGGFWHRWAQCQIAAAVQTAYAQGGMEKFSQEVKVPTGTLYKMREIYQHQKIRAYVESFKPGHSNPFGMLTYSHLVAVKGEANPVPLLKKALDEELSSRALDRTMGKGETVLRVTLKKGHEKAVMREFERMEGKRWIEVRAG